MDSHTGHMEKTKVAPPVVLPVEVQVILHVAAPGGTLFMTSRVTDNSTMRDIELFL